MRQIGKILYLTSDIYLHIQGDCVVCEKDGSVLTRVPLVGIEQIVIYGNPIISSCLVRQCSKANIIVSYISEYGGFDGRFSGVSVGNVFLRKAQYELDKSKREINLVKSIVLGKTINQRNVLLRCAKDAESKNAEVLLAQANKISNIYKTISSVEDIDTVRGIEGKIAQIYFDVFDNMLKTSDTSMRFEKRTQHPSENNCNVLLSFLYTLLTLDCTSALETFGLDSYYGYLHELRPGRHSLSCDLVEEFRAPIVDKFIITLINRRQIQSTDFENVGQIKIKDTSRKKILTMWEDHKNSETYYKLYDKKVKIKEIPYYQAQLMAQYVRGDIDTYPPFTWR